jgi:nucleotide-binding universal stress UspA family protein
MKILLAYDGSRCSEAAIDDLLRAGLPRSGDAVALSVAEVWLPPADSAPEINGSTPYLETLVEHRRQKGERILAEATTKAKHAEKRLRSILPDWNVESRATYGSPAWEVLNAAEDIKPDLIVVGSHGQSAISRFFLGSISQKVLSEAGCSVRVARGRVEVDPTPVRIVIGFDASQGAEAAVTAVHDRSWPENTEVRLISVADPVAPTAIGRFVPPIANAVDEVNESERGLLGEMAANAVGRLTASGVAAEFHLISGNPKNLLVEEAEKWNADSIFVGANAFGSRIERFLIGSTSAAVAARAHCSVEVVRKTG